MPTAEAHIETDRASRYLVQFCQHVSSVYSTGGRLRHGPHAHMAGDAQTRPGMPPQVGWSETQGTINVGWAQCTIQASPHALTLRAEAADEENLRRIQSLVTANLRKFGQRNHLTVNWQRSEAPAIQPGDASSRAPWTGTGPAYRVPGA